MTGENPAMMPAQNDPLWQALSAFVFDQSGAALTFSRRLARENGWSHGFALRVVDEYRRFLYLASRAGHPVTPSDEVDQAWHLHLVYTESYWNHLCGNVLGKPLHHGPTKGGLNEGIKFSDWYDRTFASYEKFFGEAPPTDIWPPSQVRFAPATFLRVNTAQWWMVSKSGLKQRLKVAALFAIGGLTLATVLSACSSRGDDIPLFFIAIIVLCIVLTALKQKDGKGGKGGCGGSSGCSSGGSGCSSGPGHGHSGCGSHHGGSGCGSDSAGGDSGGSSGCGSSCGGGGCGGGGD